MIFRYRCELVTIVDPDTVDLDVFLSECDRGFRVWEQLVLRGQRFRLRGMDAPERRGPTRPLAKRCTAELERALRGAATIYVTSHKAEGEDGAFGRWLGELEGTYTDPVAAFDTILVGSRDLGRVMVEQGYARAWDGRGKRPAWNVAEPYPLKP